MKKTKKRKGRREREKLALRYSPNTAPAQQLVPASIVGLRSTLFCLGCGAASAGEVWAQLLCHTLRK